jgi:protein-L-isoaspartate(D-aspartate) O-methyltransferase
MQTNKILIDAIIQAGILNTPRIINAFQKVDRKYFVLPEYQDYTYIDKPLPIGKNQTISQPSTVAFMLEQLEPHIGDKILDIGSGSAWTSSLLCYIVGESGSVIGLELIEELVKTGQNNLTKCNFANHCSIQKAGAGLGISGKKFDKILVSASAKKIPEELFAQLKTNGILIIPIKNSIYKFKKNNNADIISQEFPGFIFVPLVVNH